MTDAHAVTLGAVAAGALSLAALPVLGPAAYLAMLAGVSWPRPTPIGRTSVTFDVIVPAHNEEHGIAGTVASLHALDYPRSAYRVVVVADNCTDATAAHARAAGAVVLVRDDPTRHGKGHALAHAYAASIAHGADAVVVVDADTIVSPNLLRAFAARIVAGELCMQADYGVRNADASWRTRLMAVAFTCYHTLRSLGRERLGASCGLRGNGMAFTADLLRRHPHQAISVVEDVEYGVALGLAGVRVAYVPEARVFGEMPTTETAARSQRARWERGRRTLARRSVPPLLRAAARGNWVALDLAIDMLVPPLTTLVGIAGAGLVAALVCVWVGWALPFGAAGWAAALLCLVAYVCRGAALAGTGPQTLADLAWAPVYALWKVALAVRMPRHAPTRWVRTAREPRVDPSAADGIDPATVSTTPTHQLRC